MKTFRSVPAWLSPLIGAIFLLAIAVTLFIATERRPPSEEAAAKLYDAVQRAAVQCFALEGAFPASVRYLEENYGLMIDHDRYYVYYETFGANIRPDVRVVLRGS